MLVAVEARREASGRVRMTVLPDLKEATVHAFVRQHVAPGSTLYTDAYKSFDRLSATGVRHVPRHQASRSAFRRGAVSVVPLADRAIGNLQQWLIGTYHGVSKGAAAGLPRRICVSPQPAAAADGCVPDVARARCRTRTDALSPHSWGARLGRDADHNILVVS